SDNNAVIGYALKADVKHYFDTVDHEVLLDIISNKIKDQQVLWLIKQILKNHKTSIAGKGMPLGNLTSQFFANVYLNELDYFVKHKLKAKYYLRYVDDFVILHRDRKVLEKWKSEIGAFLKENLKLELHPEKSRIIPIRNGVTLLGFRVFYRYRLLKKSNARRIWKRLERFKQKYDAGEMERDEIVQSLEGWFAYAGFANTHNLRKRIAIKFDMLFRASRGNDDSLS
ncbi:RNA-directed DNA polymerase, partial [Candidatus Micrarchaeota archaeon]|nr:RNA-directed DNA polymerase [Candidatus Micrarchaeota archaeon]